MKVFVLLLIVALNAANIFADCVVNTTLGLVLGGEIEIESGEKVRAFCGIPYAEPPIKGLRFKDPVPKKPWKGVVDADKEPCQCKQIVNGSIVGDEDCLYVNVYTPKEKDPKVVYPVTVFIHDHLSNCRLSQPQYLLNRHKLVYVCISYRLSVFGYLSTGDESASGNFGLKDQLLALKWVKNNIEYFHGDKDDIVIFGQGTGGESVHLQAISLQSQDLFIRFGALSGIALVPRAFAYDESAYYNKSKQLGERLKCPTDDSKKLIECLRKADANTVIKESYAVFDEVDVAIAATWRPTKEPDVPGAFFNDTPVNIIKNKIEKYYSLIITHVKDEGTVFTKNLLKDEKLYDLCINHPVEVIETILRHYLPLNGKNITEIAIKAKNYYLGSVLPTEKAIVIERYTDFVTDFYYNFQIIQLARHLHKVNPNNVYGALYDYSGTLTATKSFSGSLGETGVGQGSDLFSIFPVPPEILGPQYKDLKPSANDKNISNIYIDFGGSFIANGTPIATELSDPGIWKPQNEVPDAYIEIGDGHCTEVTLKTKYSCRVDFWFDNVPLYSLD